MDGSEKPKFWRAAEAQAERLGLSAEELLRRDRQRLRESSYPTADCLDPHEVEAAIAHSLEALPISRQTHIEECAACASLLALAVPDIGKLEENLRIVREFAKSVPVSQSADPLSKDDWKESFRPIVIPRPAADA